MNLGQVVHQGGCGHEANAGGDVLGPSLLQLQPDFLHGGNGAFVLPWTSLVKDAFDRPPAKLLARGNPALEELAKQEGADARYTQQFGRQSFLAFETATGEGADQND